MSYYESAADAQAHAQRLADATGNDYVVWYEICRPHRFTYSRDNHDGTMRAPFGMRHWSNHQPTGETTS